MASLLLSSHPKPVADAIETFRQELDADPVGAWHHYRFEEDADAEARRAAASYLGGAAEQVALTDSTTMGLGLLYTGLAIERGDEILTTTHDHYSSERAVEMAAERTGATVRRVALYDDPFEATPTSMARTIAEAVDAATRVVAVTWVHSSTGVKVPIRRIADSLTKINAQRAPERRVLLCVDGVHGFGVEADRVADLGCDFFAAGCHKWLFGPRGTGILWGAENAWKNVHPQIPAFESPLYRAWMAGEPLPEPTALAMTPGGFHSFELRWALPVAFALHEQLGRARVAARIHELGTRAKTGLASMEHVRLYTPMSTDASAGIVCFDVNGLKPDDVVARLGEQGIIASTTPYRVSHARITPSLLNDETEVDRTLEVIRSLGA